MKKIGIACINHINALGYRNKLLYSIPNELKIFKEITSHTVSKNRPNIVVMGNNTFKSMRSKPLKDRFNCILSTNAEYLNKTNDDNNLKYFLSINDILEFGKLNYKDFNNMFICGGSSVYEYFINNNLLDYLIISQINNHEYSKADTFFPSFKDSFVKQYSHKHYNQPSVLIETKDKLNLDFTYTIYQNPESQLLSEHYLNSVKNMIGFNDSLVKTDDIGEKQPVIDNEWAYLNALGDVLHKGTIRQTRNSKTISKFGVNMSFDISSSFPLLTTKRVYWNGVIKELLWFLNSNTNANDLHNDKVKIWDGNSSREFLDSRGLTHYEEGDCGPIYGFQWRNFNAKYKGMDVSHKGEGVDQLQEIIDQINNDPTSRRMIMSAWNPTQLDEMCLPPCHVLYQFYVRIDTKGDKHLSCQMYQRSGDMFLGIPFNIASTSALTYILCHMTGCKPDKVIINIGDAHVYGDHINAVNKQLSRTPFEFPKLNILGSPKDKIEDYKIEDFVIENYKHQGTISAPMIA